MLAALVLAVGCSTGQATSSNGACPSAGKRACPNDTATTQAEADACGRCLSSYQTWIACDPTAGMTCVNGKSETSKDLTCKTQGDAFESCFVKAQSH